MENTRCAHNDARIDELMKTAAANSAEHASFRRRLNELEEGGRRQNDILLALQRQGDAIEAMNGKIDRVTRSIDGVSSRVALIEKAPAENWRKMGFEIIKYIVLAGIGAAIGFMLK